MVYSFIFLVYNILLNFVIKTLNLFSLTHNEAIIRNQMGKFLPFLDYVNLTAVLLPTFKITQLIFFRFGDEKRCLIKESTRHIFISRNQVVFHFVFYGQNVQVFTHFFIFYKTFFNFLQDRRPKRQLD